MAPTDRDLLAQVLHAAYDAAPEPLYPGRYALERGIDRGELDRALDHLRLGGLLRLTEWVQGLGQGYTLTQAGLDALHKSDGVRIDTHRAAPPVRVPEPYEYDEPPRRQPLIRPVRPVVSWTLIAINVAIFVLTEQQGEGPDSLGAQLWRRGVLASGAVLTLHEYWRLLSYAFLHGGVLHIFCNMYFLYSLGPVMEAMWGSARMLLLYLVAAVTGGCLVVWLEAGQPGPPTVGASGALCGLLASLGVWVLLNRDDLPPALAASLSRNVIINLALIGIMSFAIPNVSWQGHLGGALGGALASVPLQWSRHGDTAARRLLGTAGTVLVAVLFVALVFSRNAGIKPPF
jgi:membrane associated rhomboid family serine protease